MIPTSLKIIIQIRKKYLNQHKHQVTDQEEVPESKQAPATMDAHVGKECHDKLTGVQWQGRP